MSIYTKEKSAPLENRLETFYEKIGLRFKKDEDIFDFCKKLGFEILQLPLDKEKLDGMILVFGENKRIGLSDSLELADARFVLAHEVAHYITEFIENEEKSSEKKLLFAKHEKILHGSDKKPIEHDMDYLAAAILLPQESFLAELKKYNIDAKDFINKKVKDVRMKIDNSLISYLAYAHCIREELVLRRIIEVSYYA